ncbi:uncharacterized mitochondrial protein AtMg00810-like [Benincasa hispida]|uniref:uncharacterized mitochondrial protein AtMg00810-like n=1 Tax=Benincasa hispida TaxID=102211 RepID=UPI0018FFACFF|nr:uncharacterized mitochondrial protein AtMg00810-like [Benincasa hispida]
MFALKNLGKLNYFLGIQIQYLKHGFIMNQLKYVDDLLQGIGLSDLKYAASPSNLGKHLSINEGVPFTDPFLYRSTIGALQYLTNTRPDITYMVNHLVNSSKLPQMLTGKQQRDFFDTLVAPRIMAYYFNRVIHLKYQLIQMQIG